MSKKFLLIIGILIIVGIAAFLVLSSSNTEGTGDTRVGFSIRDYFPFGKGEEVVNGGENNTNKETEVPVITGEDNRPVPRLRKISNEPVAGSIIFNVGTTTFVRFVEKGTGNVYEARSDSNKIERLTNTTIPKIIEAEWLPNASGFIAQTIDIGSDVIETSFVRLNKNTIQQENASLYNTIISKLPTGIHDIAISPDSSKIFYYLKSTSSFWFVSKPDGTSRSQVYTSPIIEWTPTWVDNKNIFIYTKPSTAAKTFAYNFNTDNKTLTKTSTNGFGFSFKPKTDVSLVSNGGYSLLTVNNKTLETIDLNEGTFIEKCVWSGTSVYCAIPEGNIGGTLDSWYKGTISTSDIIKKIDTKNIIYRNVIDLRNEVSGGVDIGDIKVSTDDSHLIFSNKKDGFLWMLRVAE